MELNIFERQLQLMLMLAQNRRQTKDEICRLLGFSTRTFYRYLDAFRRMGFVVEKDGECYRLDKSSPFFLKISSQVQFSDSEAILLGNVLDSVADASPEVVHLKNKLLQLYDNSILQRHEADPVYAENLHQLYRAIRYGRVTVLRGYRSLRSDSVSDRLVEPFQFLGHNEDIRCYEHSTGQCKTFKVERIGRVVMLDDVRWSHEDEHRTLYTDLFHFSDEKQCPVTLRLNTLAKQLLLEEYPAAATQLKADGDHWLLHTQVCSWKGVGRFVLGLPGAVEVVDCPEFLNYLRQQPHF